MAPHVFKVGNTGAPISGRLKDRNGYVNLTGASVQFRMSPAPESGLLLPVIRAAANIVNPLAVEGDDDYALVLYDFQPADVTQHGIFRGEFRVTFQGGKIRSFPSGHLPPVTNYLEIIILPEA